MSTNSSKPKLSQSEAGKLGAAASLATHNKKRLKNIAIYEQNPKICLTCSKALLYDKRKNDHCSKACADISKTTRSTEKNCRNCLKELTRHQYVYCSLECQSALKSSSRLTKVLETGTFEGVASTPATIKKTLLEIQGRKCSICGLTEWQNQPIPLVMDHINGNAEDNSLANLRLVCGSCNMQLPTFTSRNRGNGRYYRRQRYAKGKSS